MQTTVTVNQPVKRPETTGTLPRSIRRNLFTEALTDGPPLKAHPETDRVRSDNLYHRGLEIGKEIGEGKHCLKDTQVQLGVSY